MKKLMAPLALGAFAALLGVAAAPAAWAQSDRENSTFTVTEPIDVGGFTLQPGTYLIKVVLLESNRNTVQVTNEDQTKVFANVLATPHVIRPDEESPSSRFIYYPAAPGQPKALRTWFAPDSSNGQDIVYPKRRALELAAASNAPVMSIPDEAKETEFKSVAMTPVAPAMPAKSYAEPAPEPVAIAEAKPSESEELPQTASRVPLLAALGLVSLGGALGLRALASRPA